MRTLLSVFALVLVGIALAVWLKPSVPAPAPRAADLYLPPPPAAAPVEDYLGVPLSAVREGAPVPRRFYKTLPAAFDTVAAGPERKDRFLALLLPLVLKVNEELAETRARMQAALDRVAAGDTLEPEEATWLMALAEWAKVDGDSPAALNADVMRRRVAPVRVSIALAQAAIESGWGSSRFAIEGNAIFGQWTWKADAPGLVPDDRPEGAVHRVRAFPRLIDSVRSYAHNLSAGHAYDDFRRRRAAEATVQVLAQTLIRYSERREAYVEELTGIIAANDLTDFDAAALAEPEPLAS